MFVQGAELRPMGYTTKAQSLEELEFLSEPLASAKTLKIFRASLIE